MDQFATDPFINGPEEIANRQDNVSAVMICDEINAEVKNLRMEVASLKTTIDGLKNQSTNDTTNCGVSRSRKLPKGLPVSKKVYNHL